MDKWEIARTLDEISRYVELKESNRFKSLAFEKAAGALPGPDRDPAESTAGGELKKPPAIGKTTASVIEELVRTGRPRTSMNCASNIRPASLICSACRVWASRKSPCCTTSS